MLTALKVKNAKPGRHGDGAGLYLLVSKSGAKSWMIRVQASGSAARPRLGFGADLTLEEAREKAREFVRWLALAAILWRRATSAEMLPRLSGKRLRLATLA